MSIVHDEQDKRRFVKSLFLLNDTYASPNWHRETAELDSFERPSHWPEQEPLVRILAWTLLSNHFHLLLQEIREGGTAKFMQKLGGSMSMCFNLKYKEKGSIFQGAYHSRTVTEDEHLKYLTFYILVKNVLEMYPGGLKAAVAHFDDAWEWAKKYPFSSFRDHISAVPSPIIVDPEMLLGECITKGGAKELLYTHITSHGEDFKDLMLEPWGLCKSDLHRNNWRFFVLLAS